jgi:predicted RNase H-like HicB family nuclease
MKREFNVIIEYDSDGYYIASVPELKGCHTQAKSLDTLMDRIKEAIDLCLEVESEERMNNSLQFIGIQRISVG